VRDVVNIDADSPDEFQVMVRAPLSMPADYGLRAPAPGATQPQDEQLRDRTRQIVLDADGGKNKPTAKPTAIAGVRPEEAILLRKLGAGDVDPNIRQVVERETTAIEIEANGFVEDLMFWKAKKNPARLVDPAQERRRLQANEALGRPANAGTTPVIERKKAGGLMQGIF
jgi:hypothetical protein